MPRLERDVRRLFELLEETIEAVQDEDLSRRRRKLETVKEKVRRERPNLQGEVS